MHLEEEKKTGRGAGLASAESVGCKLTFCSVLSQTTVTSHLLESCI